MRTKPLPNLVVVVEEINVEGTPSVRVRLNYASTTVHLGVGDTLELHVPPLLPEETPEEETT